MAYHIVLVEPEIPANTGNISRTCAATGAHLHLVRPLGFSTDDRYLKRAGLDYWDAVQLEYHDSFADFLAKYPDGRKFLATTKASQVHSDIAFEDGDFFIFGKETKGLDASILEQFPDTWMRLPMGDAVRSLNLSNAVAVTLYEALRQNNYPNLK
jgi:tRNA (cytidine/uridine-2'-O-)-methyltransferase